MQVLLNNRIVTYQQTGKGPVILLLHGWADSHTTFMQLAGPLAQKHTVIAVDLPGFGGSQTPDAFWGLSEYGHFVADFLHKIHYDPQGLAVVVGHSNGGAISLYALAHKLIASKQLVLLASSGIRDKQQVKKALLKLTAKSGKLLTGLLPKAQQLKIRHKFYSKIGSDLLVAPHMQEVFKNVVSYDILNDAANVAVPTLLIYGSQDDQTPAAYGTLLAKALPNSRLVIIEGAGHFVHQTHAAQVSQSLTEFIA
jgi:pimeloyl-ACP methyl ester carboxylesterase